MPADPTPAERREWAEGLLKRMAYNAGTFGLDYISRAQALDLAAAVRDLADENERLLFQMECANTPLMRDVMAERDALREQVERLREVVQATANVGCDNYGDCRFVSVTTARCVACQARAALTEGPQP